MSMPEEINRLVTDRLADLLLTPDRLSDANLRQEGVPEERIRFVGNIMIDTLEAQRSKAEKLDPCAVVAGALLPEQDGLSADQKELLRSGNVAVMTMHRPSNVDDPEILNGIMDFLMDEVARDMVLVWPVHPRTMKQMQRFGLWDKVLAHPNFLLLHPLGYHDLLRLNMSARIMLTDSGGLQEECCVLGTPCLTLRWNTERPVTLREHGGASVLVGNSVEKIRSEYRATLAMDRRPVSPELWDGHTAARIVKALVEAGR
jgi:UDP-N-acetylglucosamine 2-epimerase (non-hydrolysing)